MSNLSFSKARPVSVAIPSTRKLDLPVDPKLTFNSVIHTRDNKIETSIYSIDPVSILDKLEKDQLESLAAITLGCQIRKDLAVVWDVVFNTLRRDHLIACVFVANNLYHPLTKNKVLTHSQFLDQDRPISRLQENLVDKGDKIGIAIYNQITQKTYVLLYTITGHCLAQHIKGKDDAHRSRTSAVNLTLNHVYVIGEDDAGAERVDVDETVVPSAEAHTFVEWLATCSNNTRITYPWKPHFLPLIHRTFDRNHIESNLQSAIDNASKISYDQFEDICRTAYNKIRVKRSAAVNRNRHQKKDGENPQTERVVFDIPEIEVMTLGTTGLIFARVVDHDKNRSYLFAAPVDNKTVLVEKFLMNEDLKGRILKETTGIFVTEPVPGEAPYILRSLTVNF